MKKIISIAVLIATLVTVGFAQNNGKANGPKNKKGLTPVERADKRTKKLDEVCDLTTDQETKVKAILVPHFAKVNKVRREHPGAENKAIRKAELKPLRKETRKKINNILTVEQKEKLKAHREARKAENATDVDDDDKL